MTISRVIYKSKKFLTHNSSTILTCLGAIGVVSTAVMAVKATPKVLMVVDDVERREDRELTGFEMVKIATPMYIPSVIMGAATIACIFGANILSRRQQAVLTSAYLMLDNSYKEYQKKVVEVIGADSEKSIRTKIAEDHRGDSELVPTSDGEVLFFEEYSNRYFNMTMEKFNLAAYLLNRNFILKEYVNLNEFYDFLGLSNTDVGASIGWSIYAGGAFYGYQWIDFRLDKTVMDDGLECYLIQMPFEPTADYFDY